MLMRLFFGRVENRADKAKIVIAGIGLESDITENSTDVIFELELPQ